jgi:hypothetical protein
MLSRRDNKKRPRMTRGKAGQTSNLSFAGPGVLPVALHTSQRWRGRGDENIVLRHH